MVSSKKPAKKKSRKPAYKKQIRRKTQKKQQDTSDYLGDMTKSIGQLAVTGAGVMMTMGIASGVANAFSSMRK
jgi:uncharacterized protein YlxW (UPF0749 family)